MLQKIKLKYVLVAFIVLLAWVATNEILSNKKGDKSFKTGLIHFSPDEVTSLNLKPRQMAGETLRLERHADQWLVWYNNISYKANSEALAAMIGEIQNLKANGLAGSQNNVWDQFEVSDSLATHVEVYTGKKKVADLYIGKIQYLPPQTLNTYVRLAGDKKTYTVEGFLSMTFNKELADLRNNTLVDTTTDHWIRLSFAYPGDSSFVLQHENGDWHIGQEAADSSAVTTYLNTISKLSSRELSLLKDVSNPICSLTIEGNNMPDPIVLTAYNNNGETLIGSSLNPETVFNDPDLFSRIFISRKSF
jgi:hypothetical protein